MSESPEVWLPPVFWRFFWRRAEQAKPIEVDAPEDRDVWHEYRIEDAY